MKKNSIILLAILILIIGYFIIINTNPKENTENTLISNITENQNVPSHLRASFPDTDWTQVDESLSRALSGGPGKDGIPAIDTPAFTPLVDFAYEDTIRALVLKSDEEVRVYPYNILIWHEIVNDTFNGVPVAVTFCPLCGSAIVYERTLPGGVSTFGVSGSLIESNMIMYDRDTESLWQQSTGKGIAGRYLGHKLALYPFQLLTVGEIREQYPNAQILSDNTGYVRDYDRNPYGGYDTDESFIFSPSVNDTRFHPKDIFVIFSVSKKSAAVPWDKIMEGQRHVFEVEGQTVVLFKEDGQIAISTEGKQIPFYFEMWFSWAVQHKDGIVLDI